MIRDLVRRLPFARGAARAARGALQALPRPARPPQPLILMYHRVTEDRFDPWGLTVSAEHFADQVRWLADERLPLPLDEFATLHKRSALPDQAVAVTFDDAYSCTATIAAPLLEQIGVPATIFLPPELIERGEPFWWDELEMIVVGHEGETLRLGGEDFPLGKRSGRDSRWEVGAPPASDRQRAFHALWARLRPLPPAEQRAAMAQLREQSRSALQLPESKRPMTPEQVRKTASDRIAFGSHALTHPWLPSLDHLSKTREIGESRERCAALTGSAPTTFAYPYGDRDEDSERLVEQAGFLCACTTEARPVGVGSRQFALPRIAVADVSARSLARAIRSHQRAG